MEHSGKFGLAIVLSLVLSLALCTSGVFAQNTSSGGAAATTQVGMPATILHGIQQTGHTSNEVISSSQQPLHMSRKNGLRIVCRGGYVSRRVLVGGVWVWKCVRI